MEWGVWRGLGARNERGVGQGNWLGLKGDWKS